jgi:hypothetical protein
MKVFKINKKNDFDNIRNKNFVSTCLQKISEVTEAKFQPYVNSLIIH